jgi:hypothetical protein
LQVGGTSRFSVSKTGIITTNANVNIGANSITANGFRTTGTFGNLALLTDTSPVVTWGASQDTQLTRDAADTLAQRRGTNAQAFRVYNTFTDASNYERVFIGAGGGNFQIYTQNAGSGVAKELQFGTNNGVQWKLNSGGHFLATADNTYDIGANGANRPRDLHLASVAYALLGFRMGRDYEIRWTTSNSDPTTTAQLILRAGQNSTNTLCIGGTTSSFPALKRNSTALETKLADDSAFAPHAMQYLDVTDGVTAPGAATGRARIYVDSADGDLKVIFADGTIKTIVTDT